MFDPKKLKPGADGKMWAQTRDGRKVRVLCTDGPDPAWPILGIVGDDFWPSVWKADGRYMKDGYTDSSLINLPEPAREIEMWAVVDKNGNVRAFRLERGVAELARLPDETLVRLTGTWEPND